MMTIDENLMCSFQVLKPDDNKSQNNSNSGGRPGTPNKKVAFFYIYIIKTILKLNSQFVN